MPAGVRVRLLLGPRLRRGTGGLPRLPPPIAGAVEGIVIDLPTGETEEMEARLEQVRPDGAEIRVTHALLSGDPAAEIVRLAGEVGADLVVMGTHGRGGLRRLLVGSVAEGVMRRCPCPVITVKAATHPEPSEPAGKKLAAV